MALLPGKKDARSLQIMKGRASLQSPPALGEGSVAAHSGEAGEGGSTACERTNKKPKREEQDRGFLRSWAETRKWLKCRSIAHTLLDETGSETIYIDKGMFCTLCEQAKMTNNFTQLGGCSSFRILAINRHEASLDHRTAMSAPKRSNEFSEVMNNNIMMQVTTPTPTTTTTPTTNCKSKP
jgi:hypothetical protein